MNAWLAALEASEPATVLRLSFYLYPLLNALHILAIGALVTSAVLMDLMVLGLWRRLPAEAFMRLLRPLAMVALVIAITSGFYLFSVRPLEYAANPAFRLKLAIFALAVLNAVLFVGIERWNRAGRAMLKPMAALSLLLWPSILLAGRFIGFIE